MESPKVLFAYDLELIPTPPEHVLLKVITFERGNTSIQEGKHEVYNSRRQINHTIVGHTPAKLGRGVNLGNLHHFNFH